MQCTHHPENPAAAICTRCDQPICGQCVQERNGRQFCADCAGFLDQRAARRAQQTGAPPPTPAPPPPAPAAAPAAGLAAQPPAQDGFFQPQAPPSPPEPAAAAPAAQNNFFQPQVQNDFFQPQAAPAAPPATQPPPAAPTTPTAGQLGFQPAPAAAGAFGQSHVDANGLYQPPPAADGLNQGPAATDDGLYQGPPAEDGMYQGPMPDEAGMYQGPAEEGIYQGPTAAAAVESEAPAEGNLFRALLFGAAACALATGIWYGAAVLTGKNFALIALLIGWLVGIAAVAGAGRGGGDVALVAASLFGMSIFLGEWFIFNHSFASEFAPDFEEAMSEAAAEMAAYDREMANIELDGKYTDREARILLGFSQEEWNALSTQEKGWARHEAGEEWPPGSTYESVSFDDVTEFTEAIGISSEGVGLGAFLFIFPFYLGIFGWLFAAIGAWQAVRIPLAAGQ